jgi:electron transfer flavoprotein-quinone oxidoreductase
MDLAVASGVAAAAGIEAALSRGDTSTLGLAGYREALFASFAGKDMVTYARAPSFLETQRMYKDYGELLGNVLHGVFNLDNEPRKHLGSVALRALWRSPVTIRNLIGDGLAGVRAL